MDRAYKFRLYPTKAQQVVSMNQEHTMQPMVAGEAHTL